MKMMKPSNGVKWVWVWSGVYRCGEVAAWARWSERASWNRWHLNWNLKDEKVLTIWLLRVSLSNRNIIWATYINVLSSISKSFKHSPVIQHVYICVGMILTMVSMTLFIETASEDWAQQFPGCIYALGLKFKQPLLIPLCSIVRSVDMSVLFSIRCPMLRTVSATQHRRTW